MTPAPSRKINHGQWEHKVVLSRQPAASRFQIVRHVPLI
jgi:hypothetical protein